MNCFPYELRVRGLTEKLDPLEISQAIYHLVKRRGISYDLKDEESTEENSASYQSSLQLNQFLLKSQTPGEIQLERLTNLGKIRGNVVDNDTQEIYRNVFPSTAYSNEANKILSNQKQYYSNITDELIEQIIQLIHRKREYYKGPGSPKSRTDCGIYR